MDRPFKVTRRAVLAGSAALAAAPVLGVGRALAADNAFPAGFLWGASTAGHQVEGNNVASDLWYLEHMENSVFAEPSGDACNSFELWPVDLDLARDIGLNAYRFSVEWARIEPEPGLFSLAMLDHYKRIVEGCRERGLVAVVTFNHFVTPRWFAAQGGWTNAAAPGLFARYCDRVARHIGSAIGHAVTLNEPQLLPLLEDLLPAFVWEQNAVALNTAARALGVDKYSTGNVMDAADVQKAQGVLLEAHRVGKDAIKTVLPDVPVGVSIAIEDDQAVGSTAKRDQRRAHVYGAWLEIARDDDFVGVQNYSRSLYGEEGRLPPPEDADTSYMGQEIYPPSLGNVVRYVYGETGVPILVTEHGVASEDDAVRARFIPAALEGLKAVIDDGIPVKGYMHWSLLDNFEWVSGYGPKFGLVAVNRETFERTPKPSAAVLGDIARRNTL